MTNVDLASAELNTPEFVQSVAGVDTFIFGHVLVFAGTAGRGNHVSPHYSDWLLIVSEVSLKTMNCAHCLIEGNAK